MRRVIRLNITMKCIGATVTDENFSTCSISDEFLSILISLYLFYHRSPVTGWEYNITLTCVRK